MKLMSTILTVGIFYSLLQGTIKLIFLSLLVSVILEIIIFLIIVLGDIRELNNTNRCYLTKKR